MRLLHHSMLFGASFSAVILTVPAARAQSPRLRFEVSFPDSIEKKALDGRVFVIVSTNNQREPRFQAGNWRGGQPFFGIDVNALRPGQAAIVDQTIQGFPIDHLSDLPAGDYYVQGMLNLYTTFHRADGHVIKLHMDQWEGQRWQSSPGNLYSEVQRVHLDPKTGGPVRISLTRRIPPIEPPKDTRYVKHVKIRSDLVSKFWGTDMYLGAIVLLPEGFDSHPNVRYPATYQQGHFTPTFRGIRETPPDRGVTGADSAAQARAYAFFQTWTSPKMPRMLAVTLQDPNPYYDDSYAVNSTNVGPYGDAITRELIPFVEKQFRGIGQGWARTTYGGSTGGWRSLAAQVFYPDFFNGTWTFCPDPVDFRHFQLINIYDDSNAYYPNNEWKHNPARPIQRGLDNQVLVTEKEASTVELVESEHGGSGGQLDIFQAVFGPAGADGYTRLLWDRRTGAIDKSIVSYWRDNYDLRYILERDWAKLGPKLQGKIHIAIGDEDTYYLEEAVYQLQDLLESTKNPPYGGSFDWGRRRPHCYSGTPPGENALTYYLPAMADRITKTAPPGADVTGWKY